MSVASNGNASTTSWSPRLGSRPVAAATRSRITLSFSAEGGSTMRLAPSQRSEWSTSTEIESRFSVPCGSLVCFTMRLVW